MGNASRARFGRLLRAATGRWGDIVSSIARVVGSHLDGHHNPCPKCGGKDRFRAFSDFAESGGVVCNQCGKFANGVKTLAWLMDRPEKEVIVMVEQHLSLEPLAESQRKRRNDKKSTEEKLQRIHGFWEKSLKAGDVRSKAIREFCTRKPGVRPEVLEESPVSAMPYGGHICLAFPASGADGKPCGLQLARVDGHVFEAEGKLKERKYHTYPDSTDGFIIPRRRAAALNASRIFWCEGPLDAFAVQGLLSDETDVAISSLCGASGVPKGLAALVKGKDVIVFSDCDKPGIAGADKRAKAAAKAGARSVRVAVPPLGVIAETHGKDMRDWVAGGASLTDLEELIVKSPTVDQASGKDGSKAENIKEATLPESVCNFREKGLGDAAKRFPATLEEIQSDILERTGNWPKSCGGKLFVPGKAGPRFIEKHTALSAWLGAKTRAPVNFIRSSGFHTMEEVFIHLQHHAEVYDWIETVPHEPQVRGAFYFCPEIQPGDGTLLDRLVAMFNTEAAEDSSLIKALFATIFWGGMPGTRPAFLITADGRGAGKSTLAEIVSQLAGGQISINLRETPEAISTRLLSEEGRKRRLILADNVKGFRISCENLEAIITATVISGKELYRGEGSRPNYLTWILTGNSLGLGRDLAQRVINIRLLTAKYQADWREKAFEFVNQNRQGIIGDILALLRMAPVPLEQYTRWSTWENAILSKLENPAAIQQIIQSRMPELDAETEDAEEFEEYIRTQVARLGYPERVAVQIPSEIIAGWYSTYTRTPTNSRSASRKIGQMVSEGLIKDLSYHRTTTARLWIWVPQGANRHEAYSDLMNRIQDLRQRTSNASPDTFVPEHERKWQYRDKILDEIE